MKPLIPALLILFCTVSCRKTTSSTTTSANDNLLSSVWVLDPTNGWLDIDTVKYDTSGKITQITRLTYLTSTMAIPANPVAGTTGYDTYSFSYSGSSKNPVSYTVLSSDSPNPGVTEQHLLFYDSQQRLIEDSTLGVQGNDTTGYTGTNTGSRVVYCAYNSAQVIYTSYHSDITVWQDTLNISNGNVTAWTDWETNPFALGDGLERYALNSATYTTIPNPLYNSGAANIWSIAENMYNSSVQAFSTQMALSANWDQPSNAPWTSNYTWTLDAKGRLVSGVEDNGAGKLQYAFHYY